MAATELSPITSDISSTVVQREQTPPQIGLLAQKSLEELQSTFAYVNTPSTLKEKSVKDLTNTLTPLNEEIDRLCQIAKQNSPISEAIKKILEVLSPPDEKWFLKTLLTIGFILLMLGISTFIPGSPIVLGLIASIVLISIGAASTALAFATPSISSKISHYVHKHSSASYLARHLNPQDQERMSLFISTKEKISHHVQEINSSLRRLRNAFLCGTWDNTSKGIISSKQFQRVFSLLPENRVSELRQLMTPINHPYTTCFDKLGEILTQYHDLYYDKGLYL